MTKKYSKIAGLTNDTYVAVDMDNSVDRLPAGAYQFYKSDSVPPALMRMDLQKDELVDLPGSHDFVISEIQKFWDSTPLYVKLGAVHKRGVILEGPPGSGKSTCAQRLMEWFTTEMDGVVFVINDVDWVGPCLKIVRAVEAYRPIMVLIEDFEDALKRGNESRFLNVVDGRDQVDHVVFICTTNHLDQLPERVANRPSRFDLVVKIGWPTPEVRATYLRSKMPEGIDVMPLVQRTDGFSIAHLKELVLLVLVYGMSLDDAVDRLRAITQRSLGADKARVKPGITLAGTQDDTVMQAMRRWQQAVLGVDPMQIFPMSLPNEPEPTGGVFDDDDGVTVISWDEVVEQPTRNQDA